MRRKSPQAKKAESDKKDRRNTYGENSKASRTGIRRKKRRQIGVDPARVRAALGLPGR